MAMRFRNSLRLRELLARMEGLPPPSPNRRSLIRPEQIKPGMNVAIMGHVQGRLAVIGKLHILSVDGNGGVTALVLETRERTSFNIRVIQGRGGFFWPVADADAFLKNRRAVYAGELLQGR
jgi:hypothetical protein